MKKYGFRPNLLCRELFHLEDKEYAGEGESVSDLLNSVLGAGGAKFLIAFDPMFHTGRTNNKVPAVFDDQHVELGILRVIK